MNDKPIVFDSRRELKIAPTASGLTLPRNRMVLSLKLSESRRSVGMTTPWPHISQSINPTSNYLIFFLTIAAVLRKSSYRAFKRRNLKARLIARHQNC